MTQTNSHTYQEISAQPIAWAEAVHAVQAAQQDLKSFDLKRFSQVLFTGCGSTYYLSLAAAALAQTHTGQVCRGLPASELLFYPDASYPGAGGQSLLFAVSRSGTTTETLRAVERFRKDKRGPIVAITNYPDSPLASMGDINILLPAGREESIAQTRSFASMYVACAAVSAVLGDDPEMLAALAQLQPVGERVLADYESIARQWGSNQQLNQVFFLGSGPRYGLACEASLKMKEMSLTISEPFHFMEFRHGPMSMVTPQTLVVGLLSDAARVHEQTVINEMQDLGGNTLTLAEAGADVNFESGLPEAVRGVLYLPVLQMLAYHRSIGKGLNPDEPTNLSKVIELDLA